MNRIVRGLFSGLLAGLILGIIYLIDYGPGNDLHRVAAWFGLDGSAGRQIGFVLLLALGAMFGLIFGALQRRSTPGPGHAIGLGLLLGAAWWIIFAFLLPIALGRLSPAHLTLSTFLYPFMLCLVYGLLLGTIYLQWTATAEISAKS